MDDNAFDGDLCFLRGEEEIADVRFYGLDLGHETGARSRSSGHVTADLFDRLPRILPFRVKENVVERKARFGKVEGRLGEGSRLNILLFLPVGPAALKPLIHKRSQGWIF